ncbi:MAG: heterodisulfide reductase-related iron-sulfur binding cluster [Anaerolineales bacterium]|nr:heterodisulfide reductase-related iron-sulfur binding cluster [Anaerolineales bacterium]
MIADIERLHTPTYQGLLSQCVHCGLCLDTCPTYRLLGLEMDSPRGRIALMRAASDFRLEIGDIRENFSRHIDQCLACRACEAICPSGVRYGLLVEQARVVKERNHPPGAAERFLRWLGLKQLMPYPGRLKLAARLARIYQLIGLQALVRRWRFLPLGLQTMESLLPPIQKQLPQRSLSFQPIAGSEMVLFFTGCIQEGFLKPVNEATCRVLEKNGFQVLQPKNQTCCGAAQVHLGDLEQARKLARQNIDSFLAAGELAAIVCNAGGCGLALKEYSHLLADDPQYAEAARRFSSRVQDVHEFLAEHLNAPPTRVFSARVTYADSCHLRNGQKVIEQPRELLRRLPGIELIELEHPEQCCGSAGVYNIAHPEIAAQILQAKLEDIIASGAEIVAVSNTGCHLQLLAGARQSGLPVRVMHVMEILDWSYQN